MKKVFYIGAAEPAFGIIYDLKPSEKFFLLASNNKQSKLTLIRKITKNC